MCCCCCCCLQDDCERDVEVWLRRKFEGRIREVQVVMREDLDLVRGQQQQQQQCQRLDGAVVSAAGKLARSMPAVDSRAVVCCACG
jgi:hypothetical protein